MVAKQVARFPLGVGGVDLKSNEKSVPVPKWQALINVDLSETGAIKKRRALEASGTGGGTVATLCNKGQRILLDADAQTGVLGKLNGGTEKIYCSGWGVTTSDAYAADRGAEYVTGACAINDSGELIAAAVSTDGTNYQLEVSQLDPETKEVLGREVLDVGTTAHAVQLHNVADHGVLVIWADSDSGATDINAQIFDSGAWVGSPVVLDTAATVAPGTFDARVNTLGNGLFLAFENSGGNLEVKGWVITGTGTAITLTPFASQQTVTSSTVEAVGIAYDAWNGRIVTVHQTTTTVELNTFAAALSAGPTATTSTAATLGPQKNAAAVYLGADGDYASIWYSVAGTSGAQGSLIQKRIHTGTLAADKAVTMYNTALGHKPALVTLYGNDVVLFGAHRVDDPLEPVYLTMATIPGASAAGYTDPHIPTPVASYQYTTAIDSADYAEQGASSVGVYDFGTGPRLVWAAPVRNQAELEAGGTIDSSRLAAVHSVSFERDRSLVSARSNDTTLVAGGVPMGVSRGVGFQAGWVHGPRINALASTTGGSMANSSTHSVIVVYEFLDGSGRIWQSRPSAAVSVTLGGADTKVTVDYTTPIAPSRNPAVGLGVYMTTNGGSLYYRANPRDTSADDWLTSDIATFDGITIDDTDLATNEVLYTDSQLLAHWPPPPCSVIVAHKNRFAAIHSETGDIWFTTEFVGGEGVHWNPSLTVSAPDSSDKPTALASTDAALAVFTGTRVGLIYGDGPNNQGLGQTWSTVQFIPDADVGAISHKTLAKVPPGILFCDARKGFHLMPYGGGPPSPVGLDMDGAPSATIIGTAHLPDRYEVRVGFYNSMTIAGENGASAWSEASWYTWHYDRGAWSYGQAGDHETANTDCTADGNTFVFDGSAEKAAAGYDGTSTYAYLVLRTGWIILSEATRKQGLFRLWDFFLYLEAIDTHDLGAQIDYNYVSEIGPQLTMDGFAGDRIRIWPDTQSVEAVRLFITDGDDSAGGAGYKLTDMELHYGLYPGIKPRVGAADTMA